MYFFPPIKVVVNISYYGDLAGKKAKNSDF